MPTHHVTRDSDSTCDYQHGSSNAARDMPTQHVPARAHRRPPHRTTRSKERRTRGGTLPSSTSACTRSGGR
eukprot:1469825-Rhodomonas_salina.1